MRDSYDDQLRAARYRAERDQAREELDRAGRRIRGLESALQEARCTRAEDREAGEWVRGHGGLDVIEAIWDNDVPMANGVISALWSDVRPDDCSNERVMDELRQRLMPEGYEWDDRFAGAVDFFEAVHDLLYTVDCEEDHDGPEMVREIVRRLMPWGMEWPRFEDGEFVKFPDDVADKDGEQVQVHSIIFNCLGETIINTNSDSSNEPVYISLRAGERVKRPALLIPASDGKPLREGETVYAPRFGNVKCTVISFWSAGDDWLVEVENENGRKFRQTPDVFTHELPDSWERLEGDAGGIVHDIAWNIGDYSPSDFKVPGDSLQDRVVDLVRRARALADRGEK
ncbi:hypothetical protein [Collinsella intestinalis]|uniref:hypothetical protein n=1 Tax=Collinsella intestinalis TaxID=147207 RepID=UPI001957EF1A|nr:hypothetical protein [Collinsella intestinalis]MBM6907887.1 hypothetical protein [Collinsella intestinalis]MBM6943407.1 hypothetical protein [Collinsella intestinalis]